MTDLIIEINDNCSICLDEKKLRKIFITECNHTFHKKCINKWLDKSDTCPICRKILTNDIERKNKITNKKIILYLIFLFIGVLLMLIGTVSDNYYIIVVGIIITFITVFVILLDFSCDIF